MARGTLDLRTAAHRRLNPLTGEWVLVSPHRTARPWLGQVEVPTDLALPAYEPTCYLCPGNHRAGGVRNPDYEGPFLFDNDFPAIAPDLGDMPAPQHHLLQARPESGVCRVICYSPKHDTSLGMMPTPSIRAVVDAWAEEFTSLGAHPDITAVTIFENRGALMGASNPHPHGQIWANQSLPGILMKEDLTQKDYLTSRRSCLLCDYATLEAAAGERVVCANRDFVAVVPFWAVWPFETLVLPREHYGALPDLGSAARDSLAALLQDLVRRYDYLFGVPFPYTMGFHQRPTTGADCRHWHLHAHFYPPLLRSATVRKFMVGYEMLAGPQRDITPEEAADRLRRATS